MTKNDLITQTAKATGYRQQDAAAIIDAALGLIGDRLGAGEDFTVRGFGSLKLKHRPARIRRNPRTGETVHCPEKTEIYFEPSEYLTKKVNGQ